jgi:hypothetical protein
MSDPVEYWRQRAILAEGFARRLRREVSDEIRSLHARGPGFGGIANDIAGALDRAEPQGVGCGILDLITAEEYLRGLGESVIVHGWRYGGGWRAAVTCRDTFGNGTESRVDLSDAFVDAVEAIRVKSERSG